MIATGYVQLVADPGQAKTQTFISFGAGSLNGKANLTADLGVKASKPISHNDGDTLQLNFVGEDKATVTIDNLRLSASLGPQVKAMVTQQLGLFTDVKAGPYLSSGHNQGGTGAGAYMTARAGVSFEDRWTSIEAFVKGEGGAPVFTGGLNDERLTGGIEIGF